MDEPGKIGSESQGSDEPAPPGADKEFKSSFLSLKLKPSLSPLPTTSKGVENAKKRLRAFSIQKKGPLTPKIPKTVTAGNSTVLIGKLAGAKILPKPDKIENDPQRPPKPPKPPKPCTNRMPESYPQLQQKTMAEIEDMKRKMELVELGIPLGLICPTTSHATLPTKAMPTKAMPPIKGLLDPAKVDELIREAKKAKAEGKEFKFNYSKLLPDYENPFLNRNKIQEREKEEFKKKGDRDWQNRFGKKSNDKYRDRSIERRDDRYSKYHRDDREMSRDRTEYKKDGNQCERSEKLDDSQIDTPNQEKNLKETDVNLNDYLVCDSWSLDTDDKTSSPQIEDKKSKETPKKDVTEIVKDKPNINLQIIDEKVDTPQKKIEKLQPVTDSFNFALDDDDDIDMFDEDLKIEKFSKQTKPQHYDSPLRFNFDEKDENDDVFLESVINEIKHEVMSDESQDKGLVEYDSPPKEQKNIERESVTPELDDRIRDLQSQRSDYSDYRSESGRKSVDSFKSSESGYKTETYRDREQRAESFRVSMEKYIENKMSRSTVDSLETWSFVLKICQPLLFRHDRNKCYKETRTCPSIWYAENPRLCDCVKDRSVVYEELEMCKMSLVDRVYASDQLTEASPQFARFWYPPQGDPAAVTDVCQTDTPDREGSLDKEYQRFMQAVWPEVSDIKQKQKQQQQEAEVSRSTTPVRVDRKKKAEDSDREEKKKMRMSSEGWSQESEVEEEPVVKKPKEKVRNRKRSLSTNSSITDSDEAPKKKAKKTKKKISKKSKAKAKRRKLGKKLLQKLKEKKKKKHKEDSDLDEEEDKEPRKKDKKLKLKKKKLQKAKNKSNKKSKKQSSSSSSSSSSSESDSGDRKRKKGGKKKDKKKKRKQSTSESTQSDELFDVNILNNIKTEKLTDDENHRKLTPESPKPKPREIINVKQLQDDFSNNIQVKKEIEREQRIEKKRDEIKDGREEEGRSERNVVVRDDEIDDSNDKSVEARQEIMIQSPPKPVEKPQIEPKSPDRPEMKQPVPQRYEVTQSGYKHEEFEGNYEMYEQMAMAYQSDVASQGSCPPSPPSGQSNHRIETVVGARRGHIACDWRVSDHCQTSHTSAQRPSRWGLKPGDVNIVLTGGGDPSPSRQVYHIETISNSNRSESAIGYDEAYMDTYGASDLLQYGDCFNSGTNTCDVTTRSDVTRSDVTRSDVTQLSDVTQQHRSSLDDRIDKVLAQETVLGDAARDGADKGKDKKAVTKSGKPAKRVSFADGYKPGQDSDVEEPPVKKRNIIYGVAWPCPAEHPAHVPLWDCLPPPPPPPGSPPPPPVTARHIPRPRRQDVMAVRAVHPMMKIDPSMQFMPPEPPPGLLAFPISN